MTTQPTTKALGDAAEARVGHLGAAGLVLVRRDYRVAHGPCARRRGRSRQVRPRRHHRLQ
jgi:hypothetical protein